MPLPAEKITRVIVPDNQAGKRLDLFLVYQLPNQSRSYFQKLLGAGRITVNGVLKKPSYAVRAQDEIVVHFSSELKPELRPEPIPLDIIYEDSDLLVINKPAGLVVHPAAGHWTGTLVHALLHHCQQLSTGAPSRPGLVHRLDKDTSGLMVVAKTDFAHTRLAQQLKDHTLGRNYFAIICGHLSKKSGRVDLPLGRSRRDHKKIVVTPIKSRTAVTLYEVHSRYAICELVIVRLLTGRTHQIRAHFAHIGHPLLGDPEYGGRTKWWNSLSGKQKLWARTVVDMLPRQALHAQRIEFIHPRTLKRLAFESTIPVDMQQVIDYLQFEARL